MEMFQLKRVTASSRPSRERNVMLRYLGVLALLSGRVSAHPQCLILERPPDAEKTSSMFCPAEQFGGDDFLQFGSCCTDMEETVVEAKFLEAGALSNACADLYQQVVCGQCHSFSAHLFEQLGAELGPWDGMSMKQDFCDALIDACGDEIAFGGPAEYDGLSYCEKHVGTSGTDLFWSYPYVDPLIVPGELTELFPDVSDLPNNIVSMRQSPDGDMYWIVGQEGQLKRVQADDMGEIFDVVDISDGELHVSYEEGLIDVAFDPGWSDNSFFYLSHSVDLGATDPSTGDIRVQNRLSRFTYTAGDTVATRNSELILLTGTPKNSTIHSAGWVGFKPSDYGQGNQYNDLYWSHGDGGPGLDRLNNAQNLTNLHGTMVRISVPSFEGAPELYQIPSGNYPGSSDYPEICAIGLRNPWLCSFDRLTEDLWCGDVGQVAIEEMSIIECGKNYGWSRFEGARCQTAVQNNEFNPSCVGVDRSPFEFPVYQYCHLGYSALTALHLVGDVDVCGDRAVEGNAVIGGFVYRGSYFSDILAGAYVFADAVTRFVYFIRQNDDGVWGSGTIISETADLFVSFSEDINGELYLVTLDQIYHLPCGDLCASTCLEQSEQQPSIESLGCFADEEGNRALQLYTAETCDSGETYMSPLICASHCSTITGAVYSGVEAGTDCYCGAAGENFAKNGELVGEESCATLCDSDPESTCGGVDAIEVFEIGPPLMPITPAPAITVATPAPAADTTVAPAPTPAGTLVALGCFQDALDPRIFPTLGSNSRTEMSAEFCMASCDGQGFDYYGTQYGRECWCGSGTPEETYELYGELDDSECDFECTGVATENCGGFFAMTVYAYAAPAPTPAGTLVALGCFQDALDPRIFPMLGSNSQTEMSAEFCMASCDGQGFDYYGTQYGRECWCGSGTPEETYELYGELDDSECDFECTGVATENCGGFFAMTVYAY
eukprot:g11871.t1